MAKITYTALKAFILAGRSVSAGDEIDLSPIEAAVQARHGRVNLTSPRLKTRDLVPEQVEEDVPKRRRGRPRKTDTDDRPKREYRRRDMIPEP